MNAVKVNTFQLNGTWIVESSQAEAISFGSIDLPK